MKALIGVLIVVALIFGVWKIWDYWETVNAEKAELAQQAEQDMNSTAFEGLPGKLERPLSEAKAKGPKALKQWIDYNRPLIKDPRLAAIELDYVVMVSREDPIEAKKVYAEVKKRVEPGSPIARRVEALAKTYE